MEGTETASLEAGEGDTVRLLAGSNGGGSGSRQCWERLFAAGGPESRGLQSKRGPRGSVPFGGVALPARTPRAEGIAAPAPVRAVAAVRRSDDRRAFPGRGKRGSCSEAADNEEVSRWPGQKSQCPARGRRLSRAKADAFGGALAEAPRRARGSPSRRARAGAQRAAPAHSAGRGRCPGGRGSPAGAAGAARWPPAPRRPNWRRRSWQRGAGLARSGRLLPGRSGASVRREAGGPREGRRAGRGGLIADGSSYVDGGEGVACKRGRLALGDKSSAL